ncbi:MAG: hypothetical protein ACRCU3_01630 [Eubacteriaceae bacterium]
MNQETVTTSNENTQSEFDKSSGNSFFSSGGWAILWCLVFWPIGLFLMWRYYGQKKERELPRTVTIEKPLEDL